MKVKFLTLFFTFSYLFTFSNNLKPTENCLLIDHLATVNSEWLSKDFQDDFLFQPIQFKTDWDRIQKHLELVAFYLKQNHHSQLSDNQLNNRKIQVQNLNQYWKRKQFPINTYHSTYRPYFVDNVGTACAVGHLLLESGEEDFVNKIVQENNYAYLRDMPYSEIEIWVNNNGMTIDELAWIQPVYAPPSRIFEPLGNNLGIEGTVNVMCANPSDELLFMAGDFTQIDGNSANDLIAYDDENWIIIPNEIDGKILDLAFDENEDLIIVGNFQMNGIANIARYKINDQTWESLGIETMEGHIEAIEIWENKVFIGGDFSTINGNDFQNLAFANLSDFAWTHVMETEIDGELVVAEHAFAVDGAVQDFTIFENKLVVAGDFEMTAPIVSDWEEVVGQKTSHNLATWDLVSWGNDYQTNFPVLTVLGVDSVLYSAGELIAWDTCITIFRPFYHTHFVFDGVLGANIGKINNFAVYNNSVLMGGNYGFNPIFPYITMIGAANLIGFGHENNDFDEPMFPHLNLIINGEVTAGIEFKNRFFIAGGFTNASGFEVNNLAWTEFEFGEPDAVSDIFTNPDNIYFAENQLFISDFPIKQDCQLQVFDNLGKQVKTFDLSARQNHFQFSLEELPSGAFVYYLESDLGAFSGKILKF